MTLKAIFFTIPPSFYVYIVLPARAMPNRLRRRAKAPSIGDEPRRGVFTGRL
jgi:hypothetical protein